MKKPYIIFDFDGTIANTNNIIIASWQSTFRRYLGHELPVREIEATFGETLYDTVGRLIPGESVDEIVAHYRHYQDTHQDEYRVYVFEGVRELMEELKARGYKIGVATSRTLNSFSKYMHDLGMEGFIDETVTMEDVTLHKPHPESVDRVLERFGASADEAIMIGDTKYDIGCANNAGVESVLVGWSHYVDEEAMAADGFEPTYRIGRPEELLELI
ncbi:MAG: HAD family hydrolase [Mogibacterium sp.]|nr:HAD family hydrolase [Mogibacterium sp.]